MLPSSPATIELRLVTNADRAERGWPIDSEFVERFWLPAVGPSCIALLRHAARTLNDRYRIVDLSELAASLGLGLSVTKHSPIIRTLNRLSYFNLARDEEPERGAHLAVGIYRHVYALPDRLARRLPESLQRDHARAVAVVAA